MRAGARGQGGRYGDGPVAASAGIGIPQTIAMTRAIAAIPAGPASRVPFAFQVRLLCISVIVL